MCTSCEEGYLFLADSDVCMLQCGSGFKASNGTCYGSPGKLFSTNFSLDYKIEKDLWEFLGNFSS
jgi:hypothetical protein